MAKRKLVKVESTGESDLSPPPNDLPEQNDVDTQARPAKKRKATKVKEKVVDEASKIAEIKETLKNNVLTKEEFDSEANGKLTSKAGKGRKKKAVKVEEETDVEGDDKAVKKPKQKRKTKEEKKAEMVPLAARTAGHKLYIGAHVSAAGGE